MDQRTIRSVVMVAGLVAVAIAFLGTYLGYRNNGASPGWTTIVMPVGFVAFYIPRKY